MALLKSVLKEAQHRQFPALYKFYTRGELVDATVEVRGVQLRLHKIVLAVNSPVFRAMFSSGMRESRTNHIVIDDVDPATFNQIVHYLYNGFCPDLKNYYMDMFQFADKYDLKELVDMCEDMSSACRDLENALEHLALADLLARNKMKKEVMAYILPHFHSFIKMDDWEHLSFRLKTELALNYSQRNAPSSETIISELSHLKITEKKVEWLVNSNAFKSGRPITSPRFQVKINGRLVSFCFTFCRYKHCKSAVQMTLVSCYEQQVKISGEFVLRGTGSPYLSAVKTLIWNYNDINTPNCVVPARKNVLIVNLMESNLGNAHPLLSSGVTTFSFSIFGSDTICDKKSQTASIPGLSHYLDSGEFADVKFSINGQTFFGHRLILATYCPIFHSIFNVPGRPYQLTGLTANDFDAVLRYIYKNELPNVRTLDKTMLNTAKVLHINELFNHCEQALVPRVGVDTAVDTLIMSHELRAMRLKDRAKIYIKKYMSQISKSTSWKKLEDHPALFNELMYDLASVPPLIPDELHPQSDVTISV